VAKLEDGVQTIVPQPVAQLPGSSEEGGAISPLPVAKLAGKGRKQTGAQPASQSDDQKIRINQLDTQLPWAHNVLLIEKFKDWAERLWYMEAALEAGWSRDTLAGFIKNRAHARQGQAINNFTSHLPPLQSEMAAGLLKEPTFLTSSLWKSPSMSANWKQN
jgi:hypothetical protein